MADVYASKDPIFDFLVALLKQNPEFDQFTREKETTLARAKAEPNNDQVQGGQQAPRGTGTL